MSGAADKSMVDPFQTMFSPTTDVDTRTAAENQQKFNDAALGSNERTDPSEASVNNASQPRKPVDIATSSTKLTRRKVDFGGKAVSGTQTTLPKILNNPSNEEDASMYMTGASSELSAQQMAAAVEDRLRQPLPLDTARAERKKAKQKLKTKQTELKNAVEDENAFLIEKFKKEVKAAQLAYDTITASYERAGGKTYNKSKVKADKSGQQRLPFTSLNAEIIPVGIQEVEPIREQPTTLASGPPGGNFPNTSQGQPNYVPAENVGQNDLPVNYRTPTEEKHNIETEMSDVEFQNRVNYIKQRITNEGFEDIVRKVYSDVDFYMTTIADDIAANLDPDKIFNDGMDLTQYLVNQEIQTSEYIGQEVVKYQTSSCQSNQGNCPPIQNASEQQ